jgi:hypothetical protein
LPVRLRADQRRVLSARSLRAAFQGTDAEPVLRHADTHQPAVKEGKAFAFTVSPAAFSVSANTLTHAATYACACPGSPSSSTATRPRSAGPDSGDTEP